MDGSTRMPTRLMVSTRPERLEDAHRLPDHRTGDFEFVLKVLGKHDVAGRELAGDDPGPEVLNGTVVEAG